MPSPIVRDWRGHCSAQMCGSRNRTGLEAQWAEEMPSSSCPTTGPDPGVRTPLRKVLPRACSLSRSSQRRQAGP